jgi:DNA-binding transcriptional LysR family regulator
MQARELEYFLAVVEHGTFTAAASALYVTQPALSQAIHALERTLGAALFDRSGREVRLTAAGSALLEPARQISADLRAADEAVAAVAALERGALVIAAPPDLAVDPLVRLCAAFHTAHPGVQLEIIDLDRPAAELLRDRSCEIVLGFLPQDVRGAEVVRLGTRRLQVIGSDPAPRTPVTAADLAELDLVCGPPGTPIRDLIDRRLVAVGRTPRVVVEVRRQERIRELVAAGAGYAVVPQWTQPDTDVRTADFAEPWEQPFGLCRPALGLTPATAAFVAIAAAQLR